MSGPGIVRLRAFEAGVEPYNWPFVRERATDIEGHWRARKARTPGLYDGRVLLQREGGLGADGVYRGRWFETAYSAFLAWRDLGFPDPGICNGFAMAALRAADGAFLLGRMAAHTESAGRAYFPCGTPDPSDVTPNGRLDLAGSAMRELQEETGVAPHELVVGEGWTAVFEGARIACMREVRLPLPANEARALILERIAMQPEPELDDIVIVRSMDDVEPGRMPLFMRAYLAHAFEAAPAQR